MSATSTKPRKRKKSPTALLAYETERRALIEEFGEEVFAENKGHFWVIHETRPYMRAKLNLAHHCWNDDQEKVAISHLYKMLELNKTDNQGIRYLLINWLLETKQNEEVLELVERYEEDASSFWLYAHALVKFRLHSHTQEVVDLLHEAYEANPYIVKILLAEIQPPKNLPDRYALGSEEEAAIYVAEALLNWVDTPGIGALLIELFGRPGQHNLIQ